VRIKERRDKELRRGKATRPPRRRVLIACEGDKLEPAYLNGLRQALSLDKQRVVILPSGNDSAPLRVVKAALLEHKRQEQSFDHILCVVDRDTHPSFDEACRFVADHKLGRSGVLKLVVSVPCFEVWLLLHLTSYSTAAYQNATEAKARMEKLMPGYAQRGSGLYAGLKIGQAQAVQSAKRLDGEHIKNGSDGNPSTDMPLLLTLLEELAAEARW
jgi:hypothetical protein